jgi:hypothetical protein
MLTLQGGRHVPCTTRATRYREAAFIALIAWIDVDVPKGETVLTAYSAPITQGVSHAKL